MQPLSSEDIVDIPLSKWNIVCACNHLERGLVVHLHMHMYIHGIPFGSCVYT